MERRKRLCRKAILVRRVESLFKNPDPIHLWSGFFLVFTSDKYRFAEFG
ncbi:MAG: hypothetical protein ACJA0X_001500 [Cyclobacteriaceae bacterium]|jgi:hypothetical protein